MPGSARGSTSGVRPVRAENGILLSLQRPFTPTTLAFLWLLAGAVSWSAAPPYYQKQDTWESTLRASLVAKAHPETIRRAANGDVPAAGWQPVTSRVLHKSDPPEQLQVDIAGQPFLALVVSPTPDGNGCDHSVWGDPRLRRADGSSVWLDTLTPIAVSVGWGSFFAGAKEITIGATVFPHHLWAHAPSLALYELEPQAKYVTFEASVGLDAAGCGGSVQFTVENKKIEIASGSELRGDPFWQALATDFPADLQRLEVVYDGWRQDKLTLDSPAAAFVGKAQDILKLCQATLEYVQKAAPRPQFAAELEALAAQVAAGGDGMALYAKTRELRRQIILSHPALDFDRILINRTPPTLYSHNGDQHLGRHSRIGPGLTLLRQWKSARPEATPILAGKLPAGAVRNPDLHYDAEKLVFAFCDHTRAGQKRYFLYEAALDGSWVRQLTGTERDPFDTWEGRATALIEDNDPCYLPDDGIAFVSTRCQSFGRCHGGRYNPAWTLHRCDAQGDRIQQLSFGNENEYEPAVLNDGRILFTRWEYTNRHEMLFHKLWWCRPDGTSPAHFFGNDMLHPMMMVEASAIPGTHKVVATAMGHHSYNTGTTVVLDTTQGENGEAAITHVTPETPYSETQGWPNPHYSHPYPVTEDLFLVSRANHPVTPQGSVPPAANRGIYLVDPTGGRELLYEDPEVASFSPIAIRPRLRPPVLASVCPPGAPAYGTLFVQNAYLTRNDPEGKIKPGMIRALRLNALGVQPRANRTACSMTVPVEIPKKVLGTVPLNPDGSAFFRVPAQTALQIQILDENGRAILTEKSFFYLQPGENRSCVGCHEPAGASPPLANAGRPANRQPLELTPAAGPQYPGGLSFMRTVQPVLDRYCIGCHGLSQAPQPATPKANAINLIHDGKTWPQSFQELLKRGEHRLGLKAYMWDEKNFSRPFEFYSYGSAIPDLLLRHHGDCNLDRDSLLRIIEWLDLNAQCYGDLFPNKVEERGLDPKAVAELRAVAKELLGEAIAAQPERALINPAQPDESRILMAPLALAAGGWGQLVTWQSKDDPGYKRLAELVERCIVRRPHENDRGWQPSLEAGAGEDWVLQERERERPGWARARAAK